MSGDNAGKNTGLVLGFFPLIVYGILSGIFGTGTTLALAAATVASVVVGYKDLRERMILAWTNLVLFGCLLLAIGIFGMTWIIPLNGVVVYAGLASVTFGSILSGTPFTLQYAKKMVESTLWENPGFLRVNILMTGAWGFVFLASLILNAISLAVWGLSTQVAQLLSYGVLGAGIIFTIRYPAYIRKKQVPVR